jgi:ABC-type multidrug transport system ATPase subunit
MYCFLGLIRPNRGKVLLFGERPRPGNPVYRQIGYLPEEPHYHLYLTVAEAVAYYASLSGARVSSQQIGQTLDRLGLAAFRDLRLSKCSKGMKQKVGIAQCLLHAPRLLFLDEPMRGLDPIIVREFRQILADLHRDGVTIIMNSHMLPEVEALATRVAILDKGKVVAEDTIGAFTRGAADVYLVEFERGEGELPLFLTVKGQRDGSVLGTIPAEAFYAFHDYVRTQGLSVFSCVLKRRSLEETFVSIVRKDSSDA